MVQAAIDGYFSTNGIRLHYRDWGGDGRPVVLLHGLASSCHIWDLVAPQLAQELLRDCRGPAGTRLERQAGVRL